MKKKAIYLDEHERELARCICDYLISQLEEQVAGHGPITKMARAYTQNEIAKLRRKFEEPN